MFARYDAFASPSETSTSDKTRSNADPARADEDSEMSAPDSPLDASDVRALDGLLEEYAERLRRGESPSIEEYTARRPDLAEDIRLLFSTMVAVESTVESDSDRLVVPERIGDFRIVREAGRGGMGVVYEAVQESLGRRVALKVLPREFVENAKQLERFRREARSAARLHHTNIVPVFGVGEEKGVHYFAMQFIDGQGLDRIIAAARRARGKGPPVFPGLSGSSVDRVGERRATSGSSSSGTPERRHHRAVAEVGLQIAEALDSAHSQGVLHRDIKPSNLILDDHGTVWITDFGLAKSDDDSAPDPSASLTRAGDIVGTIAYLAPERLEGKADARSDVYALGLTLYELLTLEPAFHDENRRRLLRKVAEETPVSPKRLDPSIPRDLETIILTAIARDPARRYASGNSMANDLRSFLAGRPITARRSTMIERLGSWCRREPAIAALVGLVAVLLVTIASLSSFGYLRLSDLLDEATTNLDRAQTAEGQARTELRRTYRLQAHASRIGGQPGRRFDCMDAVRRAVELGPLPEEIRALRDEAIAALALSDLRVVRRWRKEPRAAFAVAPDLESYAEADLEGTGIVLRRVEDQSEIARFPVRGALLGSAHFSYDGRSLAARPNDAVIGLAVFDIATREKLFEAPAAAQPLWNGLDFQRGSKRLAFVSPASVVEVVDLDQRRIVAQHATRAGYGILAFHPGEDLIALASSTEGPILLVDAITGHAIESFDDVDAHSTLTWSADGALLAAAHNGGTIVVCEYHDGVLSRRHSLEKTNAWLTNTVFNEGGSLLAVYGWDTTLRLWDTSGGQLLLAADCLPLGFSADNRLAVTLGTFEAGIADVAESKICTMIGSPTGTKAPTVRVHSSPDGTLLAVARHEGLALLDARTRRPAPSPRLPGCESALFSADGEWLFTGGLVGLQRWRIPQSLAPLSVENVPNSNRSAASDPSRHSKTHSHVDWQPETLHEVSGDASRWIAQSADGTTLAIIGKRSRFEIVVLHETGESWSKVVLAPHVGVDRISLRPDGKQLASGTWLGNDVIVWDTESGKPVKDFPVRDNAFVEYSPDGRCLAIMTPEACFLHDATTLEAAFRIEKPARGGLPGYATFRGDGKLLAISLGRASILLVDPATGREIATLEAPTALSSPFAFSADGSHLYAPTPAGTIHDWNLSLLRRELRELGLDWDDPAD
jgi:serine/threonine protein kinase/WD40 repeat protein